MLEVVAGNPGAVTMRGPPPTNSQWRCAFGGQDVPKLEALPVAAHLRRAIILAKLTRVPSVRYAIIHRKSSRIPSAIAYVRKSSYV
jgi:hypothetical protein